MEGEITISTGDRGVWFSGLIVSEREYCPKLDRY